MSIEAFLWNYRSGEPIGFDFDAVRNILSTDDTKWGDENGCLTVRFTGPNSDVAIFLDKDGPTTRHTRGITVFRPILHPAFLSRIFRVMQLGDVMLFYSDETTPVFAFGADAGQYPDDLLQQLGEPRYAQSPADLRHRR